MKKKEFYLEVKKLVLQLEYLIDIDIESDLWDETEMVEGDIKRLGEALEILKSVY